MYTNVSNCLSLGPLSFKASILPLAMTDPSILQGITLRAIAALPPFPFLGIKEQKRTVAEIGLQKDADLLLDVLKEHTRTADLCPNPAISFLSETEPQCFSIARLEAQFKVSMDKLKTHLRLSGEDAAKYGNKHSNLVQMHHIDTKLDLKGLEIPVPHGISHEHVMKFLERSSPEVFEHWNALKSQYGSYQGDTPFLQTREAKEHLESVHAAIERAFSEGEDSIILAELNGWLEEIEKSGDFLMVRSTGAEDSKLAANAGGNVSRAYVNPSSKEVMEAVRDVVVSYFGEASLQNRINAKINPFEEGLQLSVTLQQLIGEKIGGEKNPAHIPVSFVLFTNEPLFIGEEKFRVMRISASYGHGEAVVEDKGIATDTVFILQSETNPEELYILYDNQKKLERLAPIERNGKINLEKVKNPRQLVSRQALQGDVLSQIYRSGIVMESFYGHPTDIEGVIKDGIVYFVQSRPVNRKPMLPTFLKKREGSVAEVQAKSLVAGKASVITLSKKEDILFAETLEEAEKISAEKGIESYQLVVVSHPSPSNSHPVVNFANLGIPCLYAPNMQEARGLLDLFRN